MDPEGTKVVLDVGDMLVLVVMNLNIGENYLKHNICGQVFLHYNHVNGPLC